MNLLGIGLQQISTQIITYLQVFDLLNSNQVASHPRLVDF